MLSLIMPQKWLVAGELEVRNNDGWRCGSYTNIYLGLQRLNRVKFDPWWSRNTVWVCSPEEGLRTLQVSTYSSGSTTPKTSEHLRVRQMEKPVDSPPTWSRTKTSPLSSQSAHLFGPLLLRSVLVITATVPKIHLFARNWRIWLHESLVWEFGGLGALVPRISLLLKWERRKANSPVFSKIVLWYVPYGNKYGWYGGQRRNGGCGLRMTRRDSEIKMN